MMQLEDMARRLQSFGLPIWSIFLILLLPLLLRAGANFTREMLVGRAEAKKEEASMREAQSIGEGWRELVAEIRREVASYRDDLAECLAKHTECLKQNIEMDRRVKLLEDNCRQCRLTEKLAIILNPQEPPPAPAPGD